MSDMIHTGTLGLSPAMLAQHAARKERLARFAQAAERHKNKAQATADFNRAAAEARALADLNRSAVDIEQSAILKKCLEAAPHETPKTEQVPIARRILLAVAGEFGMSVESMLSRNNQRDFTMPRFVAMELLFQMTRLSLPGIGRQLGGRDHTTVLNGRSRLAPFLESEAFRNRFEQIRAGIAV